MEIEVPRRWVILKVRADSRANVWLSFADQRGVNFTPSRLARPGRQSWVALWFFEGRAVLVPDRFQERFEGLLAGLPTRWRPVPPYQAPVALPVFVEAEGLRHERAALIVDLTLRRLLPPDAFEVARLQRAEGVRPPFRMPLDVLAVEAEAAIAPLDTVDWVTSLRQTTGLRVEKVGAPDAVRALVKIPRDVVVAPAPIVDRLSDAISELPLENQPRLVITVGDRKTASRPPRLPFAATLRTEVGPQQASPLMTEVVRGIAHDLPLHEIAAGVRRAQAPVIELRADPETNHGLRMSDAYVGLLDEVYALEAAAAPDDAALAPLQTVKALPPNFLQETTGMIPISQQEAILRAARESVTPPSVAPGAEPPPRRVDLRLRRRELSPLVSEHRVAGSNMIWVGRDVTLAADTRYAVEVQVGGRHAASLMGTAPKAIDRLLDPRQKVHLLDVVLFPLDFRAAGPRHKKMKLPATGVGPVVTFEIKTPRSPVLCARLRVCVYLGNHLLQSFLLSGVVGEREDLAREGVLQVEPEFSRSERLSDFSGVEPRGVSIAVNDDPSGTHTLMFKRGGRSGSVPFSEAQLEQQVQRVRDELWKATSADGGRRFSIFSTPAAADSEAAILELARIGKSLSRGLLINAPELEDLIREAMSTRDETLQFLRLRTTYAFPWTVMYDFGLPKAGEPICRGAKADGTACGHTWSNQAYCINGFWGVRHCIEDLLSVAPGARPPPLPRSPLRLAVAVADAATTKLTDDLKALAPGLVEHPLADELVKVLWTPGQRPSHLSVLGHLTVLDAKSGDVEIRPAGRPALLSTTELTDAFALNKAWGAPQPLVMIMACSSGAISTATLNNLMMTVARCGAAAVVGTECDSYSGLLSRFVHEVTRAMWEDGATLGNAIREFRRKLLVAGNPLGFVFTSVGDSEIHFEPGV